VWKYRVADIYKLSAERRRRGWNLNRTKDTLQNNGRSDAE
jgi:hypothetical protein